MLISIVVPTRDRAQYLRHSLGTATAIPDDAIEIVVSNNASVDDTVDVIAGADDPRIRHINTNERVSMRQNFEFALQHCKGDYVIFFGDDDGILPGQFSALRKMLETHRPDALSWDFPVYGWPMEGYGKRVGGLRFVKDNLFGTPYALDNRRCRRVVENGRLDRLHPLPAIYHGCMSRTYLLGLARQDGTCLLARSPDIYAQFRAVQHGGHFLHAHHPFSINGHSPASNGGSFAAQGGANSKSMEKPKFKTESSLDPIDDVMPISRSTALEFLSTLETVRSSFPTPEMSPDYLSWYVGVMTNIRKKDPETAANILRSMEDHANTWGSVDALTCAKSSWRQVVRKLSMSWDKNKRKATSFRCSTEIDGQNTILTAAQTCDILLGKDMDAILDGDLQRSGRWAGVKARRDKIEGRQTSKHTQTN